MPNLACGRVCFASGWAWHCRPMLHFWCPQLGRDDRWACPPSGVTSDPFQVPWWVWHQVKGEAMAVNEAGQTLGPEERQ